MSGRTARLALAGVIALIALVPAASGDDALNDPPRLAVGVVPQRGYDDADTRRMKAAGIGSVRMWFSWAQVEGTRGNFDWTMIDASVATNAKAGLTTLPYLFGTPQWAARIDGSTCQGNDCMPVAPRTLASRLAFAEFASAAVRRYGPSGTFWRQRNIDPVPIEIWQIWNEPNLSAFWAPTVDPVSYGALVATTAPAIRAIDPNAQILLAGLTGTKTNSRRMSSARFLNELYLVPGIMLWFDGIAVHPYSRSLRGTASQVRSARAIADAHGDPAALWVTELGWASAGKRHEGLVKSRNGQARMLELALRRLEGNAELWDVRGVYWYAWRDTERDTAVCAWCPWSGLIDRIGREKPAYAALRDFTSDG